MKTNPITSSFDNGLASGAQMFDLPGRMLAAIALAALFPVLVLIAFLIWLEDGGHPVFVQERLGRHRLLFSIYKFRTMHGRQVTRVGRWLRKTGLDELLQLWNIVLGDMAIVGPRPLTPGDAMRLELNDPRRFDVRPGITGTAQLFSGRGLRVSRFMESWYAKNESASLDLHIVALTMVALMVGKRRLQMLIDDNRTRRRKQRRTLRRDRTVFWSRYRRCFEQRARRPLPDLWHADRNSRSETWIRLTPEQSKQLLRSLAIFQLGESGEGRIAREIDRVTHIPEIDDDYRTALKLFVKEEGRHARILAMVLAGAGGQLVTANWTDRLFVFGRRVMGVRLKLLVLLAAEVVGLCTYGLIGRALPPSRARRALFEIRRDEDYHLRFHCDFFRTQARSSLGRFLFRFVWWCVACAAAVSVILDHAPTFRAIGVSRRMVASMFFRQSRRVQAAVCG